LGAFELFLKEKLVVICARIAAVARNVASIANTGDGLGPSTDIQTILVVEEIREPTTQNHAIARVIQDDEGFFGEL
jgi:hypothetical protein